MPFVLALGLGAAVLSEECGAIERTREDTVEGSELRGCCLELRWVLSFSPCPLSLHALTVAPVPSLQPSPPRSVWTYVCMLGPTQEGPGVRGWADGPWSLALGPVCLQDQKQVPLVSSSGGCSRADPAASGWRRRWRLRDGKERRDQFLP